MKTRLFLFIICLLVLGCVSTKNIESKKETEILKEEIIIENIEEEQDRYSY